MAVVLWLEDMILVADAVDDDGVLSVTSLLVVGSSMVVKIC